MDVDVIVEAIGLRDAVKGGKLSRRQIQHRVRELWKGGYWSPSQIGAIVGYTPAGVRSIVRDAVGPSERPEGGTLDPACLDLLLALYGAQTRQQRQNLLAACIRTGTSTRLIARLSGYPKSTVAHHKTKMKESA